MCSSTTPQLHMVPGPGRGSLGNPLVATSGRAAASPNLASSRGSRSTRCLLRLVSTTLATFSVCGLRFAPSHACICTAVASCSLPHKRMPPTVMRWRTEAIAIRGHLQMYASDRHEAKSEAIPMRVDIRNDRTATHRLVHDSARQ